MKKTLCLLLVLVPTFAIATVLSSVPEDSRDIKRVEGGAPTPPPIPWLSSWDSSYLIAEGGAPTPPPIPWLLSA